MKGYTWKQETKNFEVHEAVWRPQNPSPMMDNITLHLDIGNETTTCFLTMSVIQAKGDLKSSFPKGVFNFHQDT